MTRRIKRHQDFELSLELKNDNFIRPPRDAQRNWLLNTAIAEFVENLRAMDGHARRFVPGMESLPTADRTQAELTDEEIMEDWQVPLMRAMAEVVTRSHGDVLEVGFGRGVSAGFIQDQGVCSHTIIECNDSIVGRFESWAAAYSGRDLRILHGLWQDVLPGLGLFDGIFFHTYPLNETDFLDQIGASATFAEHFFPHAAAHLKQGGVFTYLSNEIDSLSRTHQRLLLQHFGSISIQVVEKLDLPQHVMDAWWADSMVVVQAIR
jgi:guanidinoacetate N-methyltransferase